MELDAMHRDRKRVFYPARGQLGGANRPTEQPEVGRIAVTAQASGQC